MIKYMKALGGLLLASALVACGGGGGSAGTAGTGTGGSTGGSNGGSTETPAEPTIALTLVNAGGGAVAGNAITPGSTVAAKATVKDSNGAAVASKLVTFTSTSGAIAFSPASGQVLTDASGVATVQVSPNGVGAAGADTISAAATVGDTAISASLDVQTSPANVSLANLVATQATLTAYQNTTVTVDVNVNGTPATTTAVDVNFTASCGTFSPPTTTSDSSGKAVSTFVATGCAGGSVTLSASATGATPVQTTVTVQAPQATNLLFVSAAPTTIYTAGASSGAKQSTVSFRVVDALGNPIAASTQVKLSLSSAAIAAGVVFADTNATTPETVSTDANGEVSVIVKSGGFPTPVSIDAVVVANPTITASSAGLVVNSGRAVQNFFSPSATSYNIEGWRYDGETTTINVLAADRLGQPVPDGTPVSFISEGGQITGSCTLTIDANNKSGCSVSLVSQAFRPTNGRVTVLAYMDGDEVFVDANGDNRYQSGETYYELGQPFLDSDEDGLLGAGEQKVGDSSIPGSGIGTSACNAHPFLVANVPNTCDGQWGPTRVRGQLVIVFSDSEAVKKSVDPTVFTNLTATGVDVVVKDVNGNPLPANTTIDATISGGTNCSLADVIPKKVPSTSVKTTHTVIWSKGSDPGDTCVGATVTVKATTPKGVVTNIGSVVSP
jgi:hypothetical protein